MGSEDIDTEIYSFSASNSQTGGIFIEEDNDLIIKGEGIVSGGIDGTVTVVTEDGTLNVFGMIDNSGAVGNMLLQAKEMSEATVANVNLTKFIRNRFGNTSIIAANAITQTATGDIFAKNAASSIEFQADNDITMHDDALTHIIGGDIRYHTLENLYIGGLNAETGSISLVTGGHVYDNGDIHMDLIAENARIEAGTGVALNDNHLDTSINNLSADATVEGGIFINEDSSVTVRNISVTVTRTAADGSTSLITDESQSDLTTRQDAAIVLTAEGDIILTEGADGDALAVESLGTGNVLIESRAANIYQQSVVNGGTGNITLTAAIDIQQTAEGDTFTAGSGTIDFDAGHTIDMADGALAETADSNIRLNAGNDINLGGLDAGIADVSLIAGNSIFDSGDSHLEVIANDLRIQVFDSVATGTDLLDIDVDNISVNADTGSMFINEATSITVTELAPISVNRVASDASTSTANTTDATLSDLTTNTDGHIVLTANNDVTLLDGDTDNISVDASAGAGNVLIESRTANIYQQSVVNGGTGNVSLLAAIDIQQTAEGDTFTAGSGTIDFDAGHIIDMADGALAKTADSNIRLNAGLNINLGGLDAGTGGDVSLIAGHNIFDNGDSHLEVIANDLRIQVFGSVATGSDLLDVDVDNLSVVANTGSMFINDVNAIIVTELPEISVNRVASDATTSTANTTDEVQSDLTTNTDGHIILTANNDVTLLDGDTDNISVDASSGFGNVLIESRAGTIYQQSVVNGGTGNISLLAAIDIQQTAAGDTFTAGAGTIDVDAGNSILMSDGTITQTQNQDMRLNAGNDIVLGGLEAGTASVSLIAGDNITDGGDTDMDVHAAQLRIKAGTGAGAGNAGLLDTEIDILSATAGSGGIFINEKDALLVAQTRAVKINRVQTDASTPAVIDSVQSDLTTFTGGPVIVTAAGDVTLTDGGDGDGFAVQAQGGGDVLIQTTTLGNGDILQTAIIDGGTGNISVLSSENLVQTATGDTFTAGAGTIDIDAVQNVVMHDGATTSTTNSNIRINALYGDIVVGGISAGDASVSLSAGSSILDGGHLDLDVSAANLRVQAGNSVGTRDNMLDINADNLAGRAGAGGIFIDEQDSVNITTLSDIPVNRVTLAGYAMAPIIVPSISGLTAIGEVRVTSAGSTTVEANVLSMGNSLEIVSLGSFVMAPETYIWTQGGDISIDVKGDIAIGIIDTRGPVNGNIVLVADGIVYDARGDNTTNLYAGQLDMYAHGPAMTEANAADINPFAIDISVDSYYVATRYPDFAYTYYLGNDKQALLREGNAISAQFVLQDYADVALSPVMQISDSSGYQTIRAWTNKIIDYNRSTYNFLPAATETSAFNNLFGYRRIHSSLFDMLADNDFGNYFSGDGAFSNAFGKTINSALFDLFLKGDFLLDLDTEEDDELSFFREESSFIDILTGLEGISGYYDNDGGLFNFWTESIEL